MFHIKTDIRQYKCESEQKVERLIRNWVIRPTDLIYDAQKDSWNSIGEHAAFHAVFVTIEKEEANEPDTVVTQAPSEIAAEFEVRPGSEHDDFSDADSTLTFDALATDADEQPEYPRPPEAPEGVEGLIRDSDEITMMTDRTLDMFRESVDGPHEDEAPKDSDAPDAEVVAQPAVPVGRHDLPEDVFVTDEIFRADIHASIRDDLKDLDDDDNHRGPADREDDEVTQMVERDSVFNDNSDAPKIRDENEASAEDAATLHAPSVDTDTTETLDIPERDDTSADASSEDAPADADPADDKARWRIVLSEDDDAPEESAQTDESGAAQVDVDAFDDYQAMDDAELDAMLNEAAALVGLGEDGADTLDGATRPKEIEARQLELLADVDFGEDDFEKDAEAAGWARTKTPVRATLDPKTDISGGYALPLPLDVSPSAEAIKLGLLHSRLSREVKNAVFPHPQPKVPGEMARRVFDLAPVAQQPPRDQSLRVIIAIVFCIMLVLFIAVTFFG